jgi:energy-coupling factor transporter ATP-binding protein EcfA2
MSINNINPLHLDIEFQNLGKIKKANIKIRPFTVVAGCNASGKSFITKTLYSILSLSEVLDISHIKSTLIGCLIDDLGNINDIDNKDLVKSMGFDLSLRYLSDIYNKSSKPSADFIEDLIVKLNTLLLSINSVFGDSESTKTLRVIQIETYARSALDRAIRFKKYLEDPETTVLKDYSVNLQLNLLDNYMVSSLKSIINNSASHTNLSISGVGEIIIEENDLKASKNVLLTLSRIGFSSVIYLESPIYWKLTKALEQAKVAVSDRARKRNLNSNSIVSLSPKYFFDTINLLQIEVKDSTFTTFAKNIELIIGGELNYNNGEITFSDMHQKFINLSLAASGSTNLGMLALLLKRGAILPGSVLFIDEPEVHLHPAWQVILVKTLYELSKRGVTIIIASHSIDIMKAIEMLMDSDDEIDQSQHFGINQLTADGMSVDISENNFKRLAAIKEDLGKPFYDMFIEEGL